jgi:hypothetical protein
MRIAAGDPKSVGTVKSAEYSTTYGTFDGFGNQPLTYDSTLFPLLVTENVTKQQKSSIMSFVLLQKKYDEFYSSVFLPQ